MRLILKIIILKYFSKYSKNNSKFIWNKNILHKVNKINKLNFINMVKMINQLITGNKKIHNIKTLICNHFKKN